MWYSYTTHHYHLCQFPGVNWQLKSTPSKEWGRFQSRHMDCWRISRPMPHHKLSTSSGRAGNMAGVKDCSLIGGPHCVQKNSTKTGGKKKNAFTYSRFIFFYLWNCLIQVFAKLFNGCRKVVMALNNCRSHRQYEPQQWLTCRVGCISACVGPWYHHDDGTPRLLLCGGLLHQPCDEYPENFPVGIYVISWLWPACLTASSCIFCTNPGLTFSSCLLVHILYILTASCSCILCTDHGQTFLLCILVHILYILTACCCLCL